MHSNVTSKIVVGFTLVGPPCIMSYTVCLQCSDTVDLAARRASGL